MKIYPIYVELMYLLVRSSNSKSSWGFYNEHNNFPPGCLHRILLHDEARYFKETED